MRNASMPANFCAFFMNFLHDEKEFYADGAKEVEEMMPKTPVAS